MAIPGILLFLGTVRGVEYWKPPTYPTCTIRLFRFMDSVNSGIVDAHTIVEFLGAENRSERLAAIDYTLSYGQSSKKAEVLNALRSETIEDQRLLLNRYTFTVTGSRDKDLQDLNHDELSELKCFFRFLTQEETYGASVLSLERSDTKIALDTLRSLVITEQGSIYARNFILSAYERALARRGRLR